MAHRFSYDHSLGKQRDERTECFRTESEAQSQKR
jgi:hypothetical protein